MAYPVATMPDGSTKMSDGTFVRKNKKNVQTEVVETPKTNLFDFSSVKSPVSSFNIGGDFGTVKPEFIQKASSEALFSPVAKTSEPLATTNTNEEIEPPTDEELQTLLSEGYTEDEIVAALYPEEKPKEKGFMADVKESAQKRLKTGEEITSTDQTGFEIFFQEAGQGAGFLGDVAFAGLKAATPDFIKEGAMTAGKAVVGALPDSLKEAGISAAKSGMDTYSEWKKNNPRAALNLEAIVNVGSLIPIGKGAQVAGKGAIAAKQASWEIRDTAAKKLLASAEGNVSRALAPTKAEMKMKTAKLAPEFIKKGIVGSRENILKKADEGVEDFGKQIENYISEGKLTGVVEKKKINDVIDEFSFGAKTKAGVVIDEERLQLADKMRAIVGEFDGKIPAEEAKSALRVLGDMTARKKGFTTGSEKLSAQLERDIYGVIARELAKSNPELDKLNKSFSFYKNLSDVTKETIGRTAPQSGMLKKGASLLFAGSGQGQGVLDTAIRYVGSKLFLDFVSSSFYETLSARLKRSLANAIATGNEKAANNIIQSVKKIPKPSSLPTGKTDAGKPLIKKANKK